MKSQSILLEDSVANPSSAFAASKEKPLENAISPISTSDAEMETKSAVVTVKRSGIQRGKRVTSEETLVERRCSSRLKNKREKPNYNLRKMSESSRQRVEENVSKKAKVLHKTEAPKVQTELPEPQKSCDRKLGSLSGGISGNTGGRNAYFDRKLDILKDLKEKYAAEKAANAGQKSAYAMVKDTLRIFNSHYLHFVQEEEQRCKKLGAAGAKHAKEPKSKGRRVCTEDTKRSSKRPDLKAISKMIDSHTILYPEKRFGHIPGVDVGHQFFSRAEMCAIGFHGHWLCGIDFMGPSYKKLEIYKNFTLPLAVSIVLSGQYEDDLDNSETIVYTGQGGNDLNGSKHQVKDQELVRGNLALKNSMVQNVPVRVTRGHESVNSYCGKVYTYDGLYKVLHYWAEKGVSGFTVFKYQLRRLEGQPALTTNQVHFTRAQAPKSVSGLHGLVCDDISGGRENIPIPATNVVDNPPVAPTGYVYCKNIEVAESVKLPLDAIGCNCKGNCVDPDICACARLNGCDFPYVHKDGGRLVEAKDVVFECGPNCGCGPGCVNRTSQRGLKYRLEVFRTPNKGWAVRSWDSIPSGAPVCEYTGILKRTDELDSISGNDFIFEIDCLQTMKGLDGRERRLGDVSIHANTHLDKTDDRKIDSVPEFCIDAGPVGNVARFINHSCEPNLFVQCVLSSHHDIKLARVMLFAADNIPPLQELTYDYGYALNSVIGPDGNIRKMACYCGAPDCRKRLY